VFLTEILRRYLVGLATPTPAPRPPSPPTLERLRRDNTMITTNYSCRKSLKLVITDILALDLGHDRRSDHRVAQRELREKPWPPA
jgi:hypothetical protein